MGNTRRRLVGRVVSDKMEKTVTVMLERRKMHRVYKKVVGTSKKVMAHDESNSVPVGAIVRIVESRPLSKNKRWVVEAVLDTPEQMEQRKLDARHAARQAAEGGEAQES
jgi:small subunit ribosomal protein S17